VTAIKIPCRDRSYPIPRAENQALFKRYERPARETSDVVFVARLATYRYYIMDQGVGPALATYRRLAARVNQNEMSIEQAARQRNNQISTVTPALCCKNHRATNLGLHWMQRVCDFRWRHVEGAVSVRRYGGTANTDQLSNLEEMLEVRGVKVDHTTFIVGCSARAACDKVEWHAAPVSLFSQLLSQNPEAHFLSSRAPPRSGDAAFRYDAPYWHFNETTGRRSSYPQALNPSHGDWLCGLRSDDAREVRGPAVSPVIWQQIINGFAVAAVNDPYACGEDRLAGLI
jgi:hypothetical protein